MSLVRDLKQRFWEKADVQEWSKCWNWQAAMKANGYGMFNYKGKNVGAHRVAYFLTHGVFDSTLDIDHLCRNRACVNPWHLERVTRGENVRRGISGQSSRIRSLSKTECPKGHQYDETNTYKYTYKGTTRRGCKECRRNNTRKWRNNV